jgi:hypothetical protein
MIIPHIINREDKKHTIELGIPGSNHISVDRARFTVHKRNAHRCGRIGTYGLYARNNEGIVISSRLYSVFHLLGPP